LDSRWYQTERPLDDARIREAFTPLAEDSLRIAVISGKGGKWKNSYYCKHCRCLVFLAPGL
jgi:hypothetical protein